MRVVKLSMVDFGGARALTMLGIGSASRLTADRCDSLEWLVDHGVVVAHKGNRHAIFGVQSLTMETAEGGAMGLDSALAMDFSTSDTPQGETQNSGDIVGKDILAKNSTQVLLADSPAVVKVRKPGRPKR